MVAFNMLWKLCVVVALGYYATVTSTEVAPEQPKKESWISRFFRKGEELDAKPVKVSKVTDYPVEWYLLPEPQNRKYLRDKVPFNLFNLIPKDCNEPIDPEVEKEIRDFLSVCSVDWHLESKPENRKLLRYRLPWDLAEKVPEECDEPIKPEVEKRIRAFFSLSEEEQRSKRKII